MQYHTCLYKFTAMNNGQRVLILIILVNAGMLFIFAPFIEQATQYEYHRPFDAISYIDATQLLTSNFSPHPLRSFGYAFFLALPYLLFKTSSAFFCLAYLMQFSLLCYSTWLLYKTIRAMSNHSRALHAVIIMLCNMSYVIYTFHITTEIYFLFLIIAAFYHLQKYLSMQKNRDLLLSFALVCIATLCKPVLIYICVVCFIALIIYFVLSKKITACIPAALIILLSIGLQIFCMHAKFNIYKISCIDDLTMYRYLHTSVEAAKFHKDIATTMLSRDQQLNSKTAGLPESTLYNVQHTLVKEETRNILQNDLQYLVIAVADNFRSNFHTGNTFIRDMRVENKFITPFRTQLFGITRIWNMLFVICLLILNFVYAVRLIRRTLHPNKVFLLQFLLLLYADYIFVTAGTSFYQGDRFNIVWMPAVLIILMTQRVSKKMMASNR